MIGARVLTIAAIAACLGCGTRRPDPADFERQTIRGDAAARDLDILFVIDNSSSMVEEQQALLELFPNFIEALRDRDGVLPNMHIGVTTTDLGAGLYNIAGCTGTGDDGRLLSTPREADCPTPTGAFISDFEDPDCEGEPDACRVRNFDASARLEDVFSCIARVGTDGCGFEQPLEAMYRALERNPTFVREGATLAVIIVSDEDDCSARDGELFSTFQTELGDPLGPVSSYRCFEFGVECDPDEPRELGAKDDCVPREDSELVHPLSRYEDFLTQLKGGDGVVLAGIVSPPGPVESVWASSLMNRLELAPVCTGEADGGETRPSIRLNALFDRFPGTVFRAQCTGSLPEARATMQSLGENLSTRLNDALTGTCVPGCLFDTVDDVDGVQPDCEIIEGADLTEIPPCDDSGALPCFEAGDVGRCPHTESGVSITVVRDTPPADGTVARISCRVRPGTCEATQSFYDCTSAASGRSSPWPWLPCGALLLLIVVCVRPRPGRRSS